MVDRGGSRNAVNRVLWAALITAGLLVFAAAQVGAAVVSGTKTVAFSPSPGGPVIYTIVLTNTSGSVQNNNAGDEFIDVLPSELTLIDATATSGTALATSATNTVTWNGSIAPGGSVTITIDATSKLGTPGGTVVSNQGTINFDADDSNNTNESSALTNDPFTPAPNDPTTFTLVTHALVGGAKVITGGTFIPGGTVTYQVLLSNFGDGAQPDNATDEFTDVLPSQLTLVSASATSGTAAASVGTNTVTWNRSLAPGGSVTITINATIKPGTPVGTVVSNQGTIAYDFDDDGTNESSAVTNNLATPAPDDPTTFTVLAPALVTGTRTVFGTFLPGGTVIYTVALTNSGGGSETENPGDEFVDVLPASLTLVSAVATGGTAAANVATNTVTWTGAFNPGHTHLIFITATIKPGTPTGTVISNQGSITFDADNNGTNDTTVLTDNPVTATVNDPTTFAMLSPAAVSGTKTVSGTFSPGGTVLYTVVLTNSGSGAQDDNPGDEFVDVLPPQLTLGSVFATSGTVAANPATNTVTWNGTIAGGGSVTISIAATVGTLPPGTSAGLPVTNQGTIHFDADGNGTNEATASTPAATFVVTLAAIPTLGDAAFALLAVVLALGGARRPEASPELTRASPPTPGDPA